MPDFPFPEGTTTAQIFTLTNDDGTVINLTGYTVDLKAEDKDGTTVTLTGTTAIVVAASGTVSYTPGSPADFTAAGSPYAFRWELTDAGGLVSYVPDTLEPDYLRVPTVP